MIEDFQIEEMIEQTQRFVSYKAYNTQSGRKCLIKRYLIDKSSGLGEIENWEEEFFAIIREFSRLEIPSLRSVFDGGIDPQDGSPYAVFEWLEVSSLSEVMKDQSLELGLTKDMSHAVLDAITFMHERGLIHGDICPQSIFYTDSKEKNAWLLNWDPVRTLRCKHGVNRFGMNLYVAPELLKGEPASAQSDLYALGKTVEKVAGEYAKEQSIQEWVSILGAEDPGHRYESAEQTKSQILTVEVPDASEVNPQESSAPKLIVGNVATTTPPLKIAIPVQGSGDIKTRETAQHTIKSTKKKSGGGAVVLISILLSVAALGIWGLMFLKKQKEQPKEALVPAQQEGLSSDTPEVKKPSISEESIPIENIESEEKDFKASDFSRLSKVVKKTIAVKGEVEEVLIDKSGLLSLVLNTGEKGQFLIEVDADDLPERAILVETLLGQNVFIEGYLENPGKDEFLIYTSRLRDVRDLETRQSFSYERSPVSKIEAEPVKEKKPSIVSDQYIAATDIKAINKLIGKRAKIQGKVNFVNATHDRIFLYMVEKERNDEAVTIIVENNDHALSKWDLNDLYKGQKILTEGVIRHEPHPKYGDYRLLVPTRDGIKLLNTKGL